MGTSLRGWGLLAAGFLFTAAALAASGSARGQPPSPARLGSSAESFTLPNGLQVVLVPDAKATSIAVAVAYSGGRQADAFAEQGMAEIVGQLLEAPSTRHLPRDLRYDFFRAIGTTEWSSDVDVTRDYTRIVQSVPPGLLPIALWLEADRMAFLLDGVDDAGVGRAKEQAASARGEDGVPAYKLARAALYGAAHPYGKLGNGGLPTIDAAAVRAQIRRVIVPRNAVLALTGLFDPAAIKGVISADFGPIADAPPVVREAAPAPAIDKDVRLQIEQPKTPPLLLVLWPAPVYLEADDLLLDGVASVLGARLEKRLVDEAQIAMRAGASESSKELVSEFSVFSSAKEGHTADELLAAVDEVIAKLKSEGPTLAEATRAQRTFVVRNLVRQTDPERHADQLLDFVRVKSDGSHFPKLIAGYEAINVGSLRAVIAKYLRTDRRVCALVTPNAAAPPGGKLVDGSAK